ncbi:hypothetical protein SPRG_17172 [Saprolegnia parasitica CBS 223.65]|uniref:SWIM-type domain-containing protein n=1 Tax=Saprolegnia parasitica (strain CBS 223.65) TaxID=695850 RepID=A0A067BKH9_SAPPC|nr:hypothetical protein SPRG_17172 [Saprolegnia parasitica CBS 223.65]KDO17200.1 hypothetical protein SPRG_17172 [Saprolegnia parasitica CBS 223.65]|eukprot:XP_012212092.1 hypothetical protein SPRG_17172 [Saprolegnia parasitica CBS 223.65]
MQQPTSERPDDNERPDNNERPDVEPAHWVHVARWASRDLALQGAHDQALELGYELRWKHSSKTHTMLICVSHFKCPHRVRVKDKGPEDGFVVECRDNHGLIALNKDGYAVDQDQGLASSATSATIEAMPLLNTRICSSDNHDDGPVPTLDMMRTKCDGYIPSEMIDAAARILSNKFNYLVRRHGGTVTGIVVNASKYQFGPSARNPTRITLKEADTYMRSIIGNLGGIATVDELEINFLSKHHVRINADIEVERAEARVIWTPDQADLVAEKYQCDCKGSFTTGWICSHSVAVQSIMDDLDTKALLAEVAPRRHPGAQRKALHPTFADGTLNPFFSVANMVALLVDKPGYCYN